MSSKSPVARRLAALEEVLTAELNKPIPAWMDDPEQDPDEFIDQLVAEGKVADVDRHRVFLIRWMNRSEAEAAGVLQPPFGGQ